MGALRKAVLRALVRGSREPWSLERSEPLLRAFDDVLAGPDAAAELKAVLKIIVALDRELGSPGAANELRAIVRAHPAARALLGQLSGPNPAVQRRKFERLQGDKRAEHPAALLSRPPPPGAISVQAFLNPITRQPLRRSPASKREA